MSTNDTPFNIVSSEAKKHKKAGPHKVNLPETLVNNREMKDKVQKMRDRMDTIRSSIDEKIDNFSQKKGISKEKIWEYINNSGNFTPEEWDVIRHKSKALINKVWDSVDGGTREGFGKDTPRKGKFIGSRRNWIPTR
jgi:hypothetical protein